MNNAGYNVNAPMLSMNLEQYDAVASVARGTLVSDEARAAALHDAQGHGPDHQHLERRRPHGQRGPDSVHDGEGRPRRLHEVARPELAGREILVNSVAPGFVETEMTDELPEEVQQQILAKVPLGRIADADEIADVVAFLATRGSYVNGSVLHVNGGMYGG